MKNILTLATILLTPLAALQADTGSPQVASFSFVPSQLAGNLWFRPGTPHSSSTRIWIARSGKELWPNLLQNLKRTHGSFSIFAAEIGYLTTSSGLLPLLKSEGIPISAEVPGFMQCIDGALLANAEIKGEAVDGTNLFSVIFRISNATGRTDPAAQARL